MENATGRYSVRLLLTGILIMLMLTMFSFTVSAASLKPGRVSGVSGTVKESRVELTWKKVKNADGYYIYVEDTALHDLHAAYRIKNGSFSSKEDLLNVPGIKEGIYDQIEALITVK